jgi:hypothetical protein
VVGRDMMTSGMMTVGSFAGSDGASSDDESDEDVLSTGNGRGGNFVVSWMVLTKWIVSSVLLFCLVSQFVTHSSLLTCSSCCFLSLTLVWILNATPHHINATNTPGIMDYTSVSMAASSNTHSCSHT